MNKEIKEYTITNGNMKLSVLNLGGVITELSYKGQNIVLKFEDYNAYLNNSTYMGSIVGRSAGRIRDAKIDGWDIPKNFLDKHNLHGNDIHYKFYDVKVLGNIIEMELFDEEGAFPGNATIKIIYTLLEDRLVQEFIGNSDKPTVFNMTNHAYFNLDSRNHSILDHMLTIKADLVGELDEDLLPIGDLDVTNTAFDFREPKMIREAYNVGHDQFKYSKFIDHPYTIKGDIKLELNSLELEVKTDQKCLVVYCGNYIGSEENKLANSENKDYQSICLETQARPNTTDLVTDYYAKTEFIINEK